LTSPFSAAKAIVFGALCVFCKHDMRAVNLRCARHHKKALYALCTLPSFDIFAENPARKAGAA